MNADFRYHNLRKLKNYAITAEKPIFYNFFLCMNCGNPGQVIHGFYSFLPALCGITGLIIDTVVIRI